jgi:penicillin-binding protein 1C
VGSQPLVRDFGEPGDHVLTALADSGAWTRIAFTVLE